MAFRGTSRYLRHGCGAIFWVTVRGLARVLPYSAFRFLGREAFSLFYALTGKKLRKVAYESLTLAFGNGMPDTDKQRIADAAFENLVGGFIGHVYSLIHPGFADRVFLIDGQEYLDTALKRGKGAVIATAHFGPFSWMMCKFIDRSYRVSVVMRPPRNEYIYRKFRNGRKICGLNVIYSVPVRQCVVECVEALKKGELVFIPADQNYGGAGRVFVDFFRRRAATAPGPAMFALKTGAPLFFAYALPEGDRRFRITVSPEIELCQAASERETLITNTALVTKMIEDLARQHPEQWSWMHKRWKTVPRDGEI